MDYDDKVCQGSLRYFSSQVNLQNRRHFIPIGSRISNALGQVQNLMSEDALYYIKIK